MTRRLTFVGLIAALTLAIGIPGLLVTEAGAETIKADMAMMKATGTDLAALRYEIQSIQADLQRLTNRVGTMTKMIDSATTNYCSGVSDALLVSGFAPGLCK